MAQFFKFSGTTETVGIDIGSHSIKVVQVVPTRQGYEITRAGSTPTPPEAIRQGVIEDRIAVSEAVHNLMRTLGITTRSAVAAVAGPTVVIRQVQMPAMPEHQLRKSIYWEAVNFISFPVENSLLEFQILGTNTTDGSPQMDVMLVAVPRDLVDTRVEVMEQSGLEPIAVELEPFALMRSAVDAQRYQEIQTDTIAIVEIGATYTHISIMSNGNFVLSRSVTIAGNSFTDAIAKALGLEMSQAEAVKENEVRVVTDEISRAQLSPVGQEASRALEPQMEELVREIRRSFAFYDYQQVPGGRAQRAESGVSKAILTGGSAKMAGLAEYLKEQLNVEVLPIDLFTPGRIALPPGAEELHAQGPLLATALGLALREPMIAREKGGHA